MDTSFRLWPESASTVSDGIDYLFIFLLCVTAFFTVLICILIWFFALKYRKRAKVDRTPPKENMMIEVGWSVLPIILTMIMFFWGAVIFYRIYSVPQDADEITVVGKQWMWKIQHPSGRAEINELHVPLGRPVRLKMISEDVIHSFYVPAFRVKQDVLPGRYTTMWFEPTKVGTYHLFCAEYCGTSHSGMIGKVVVMEPADYAAWLAGDATAKPAEVSGQELFENTCKTCHAGTSTARCPPLENIYGKEVKLANGQTVIADETYLRESILEPAAKIVDGYQNQAIMPTYKGQLSEEAVLQLIAYIKTLGDAPAKEGAQKSDDGASTSTRNSNSEPGDTGTSTQTQPVSNENN